MDSVEEGKTKMQKTHRPLAVAPAEFVAGILGHSEPAKNEPSCELPHWVAEVLLNEELMAEFASGYDVEELLEKLTAAPVPLAA